MGTDLPESRAYRVQSLRLVSSRGSEAKTAMEGMIHIRHIAAAISTNQSWKIGTWKAYDSPNSQFMDVEIAYFCHQSPIHLSFLWEVPDIEVPLLYSNDNFPQL